MESSQPPGEGSPRPRPDTTSLSLPHPGGALVGRTDRLTRAAGATIRLATILGTLVFTPALCFGRRIGPREDNDETCSNRRNHGDFGFHRLGGVGECTSQYKPEPLPE